MPDRREAAIAHARRILAVNQGVRPAGTEVEKTIWGSPAGKKRLADRLVAMLPAHKTYVEPFAGSAAVLFAKEPSDVEVINDADLEIADAYRLIKKLTPEGLAKLKKLPWVGDEKTFKRLLDVEPEDDVERLHRFLYLTHFSYGKMRGKSFSPTVVGVEATTIKRIEKFAPRLKKVKVYGGDYEKVVRKYDSKDTVFFLDPPYPGYNVDVGESEFDEERFFKLLKSLKGRFLITYGIRGKFPELVKGSDFWSKRIRTRRSIAHMRGVGGSSVLTQLLVANYEPTTKALDDEFVLDDWDGALDEGDDDVEKAQPFGTFGGSFHYAKRIVPLIPALQNGRLLAIHVSAMMISYAVLTVAFSGAVMFLVQGVAMQAPEMLGSFLALGFGPGLPALGLGPGLPALTFLPLGFAFIFVPVMIFRFSSDDRRSASDWASRSPSMRLPAGGSRPRPTARASRRWCRRPPRARRRRAPWRGCCARRSPCAWARRGRPTPAARRCAAASCAARRPAACTGNTPSSSIRDTRSDAGSMSAAGSSALSGAP